MTLPVLLAEFTGIQLAWSDVGAIVVAFLSGTAFMVRAIWTTKGTLAEESKQTALLKQSIESMARKLDEALADKREAHKVLWERVQGQQLEIGRLQERVARLEGLSGTGRRTGDSGIVRKT